MSRPDDDAAAGPAPETALKVRPARAEDAEAVAEMAAALAEITAGRRGPITAADVCADLLERDGLGLLVAEVDGAVVGYALWTVAYESAFAARGLYLSDLFVRPEARRHGAARALVRAVAQLSTETGGLYVWLVAAPDNDTANAFYDRLGATRDPMLARAVFGPALERLVAR